MDGEVTRSEPHGGADAARDPWWLGYVRPKGNIPPTALLALLMLACVPLVMVLCRVLAFPGVEPIATIGFDSLREFGQTLNESLSLAWVPAGERDTILYLLLLPTGALLIVLARLTFGLRVLGLRAILIGIGIQEAGLLPSLMLIAVVVGVIVAVRPSLRRIRLPMYARVAVVLSLAAMIMVGGLLVGPWVHSQAVWNVAFFPVIIVAMLAESIAKTLARDNVLTAVWRASWTILLALLIALIGQTTAVGEFVLRFPEILVSELVAIVLIAEFLDLRLLEEWPARLTRLVEGTRPWYTDKPRVAVVRNRWSTGVIGRLGNPAPAKYRKRSVQQVVDALRDLGFRVKVIEAEMSMVRELQDFLPPDPRTGMPGGIVLNLATGAQGSGRFGHVPAMLEMAGVAYTGPDPVAHTRLLDRHVLLTLLARAGVPVPRHGVLPHTDCDPTLRFPLAVRPRCEPDVRRVIVTDRPSLAAAVHRVRQNWNQEAVVEESGEGRDFRVYLLGNDVVECLPLVEYRRSARDRKICPAAVDAMQVVQIRNLAFRAYRAAGCRDYARIDVRVSQDSAVTVTDVKWADLFARRGAFARAGQCASYDFASLMLRVIDVASRRYDRRAATASVGEAAVVSLAERRAAAR